MKKHLLFFLIALIGLTGSSLRVMAQDDPEPIKIATAEDLVAFSEFVNAGNYDANAILTADIDMSSVENFTPIGHFGNEASSAQESSTRHSRYLGCRTMPTTCCYNASARRGSIALTKALQLSGSAGTPTPASRDSVLPA